MPEYLAPGVYVEEVSFRAKSIEGVGTSTTAFVGPTRKGPLASTQLDAANTPPAPPELLTSFGDFVRIYGGIQDLPLGGTNNLNFMAHAVLNFFNEGGSRLYVARVANGAASAAVALAGNLGNPADADRVFLRARSSGASGNGTATVREALATATSGAMNRAPAGTLVRAAGTVATTPASIMGGTGEGLSVPNGSTLRLDVSGAATDVVFQGLHTEATGDTPVAEPLVLGADSTLTVTLDGGAAQDVVIPAATYNTVEELAVAINIQLTGGYARVTGTDELVIGTDVLGHAGTVDVAINADFGFTAAANETAAFDQNTNNLPNLGDFDAADLNTLLAAVLPTVTSAQVGGRLVLSTVALGATETLAVVAGADPSAHAFLGFTPGQLGTGSNVTLFSKQVDDSWQDANSNPLAVPAGDTALVGSFVDIIVTTTDGDGETEEYTDISLVRTHARYVGQVMGLTGSSRADALQRLYGFDIGANVDSLELHTALFPPGNTTGDIVDGLIARHTTTGGANGGEPSVGVPTDDGSYAAAFQQLRGLEDISIIAAPGHSAYSTANYRAIQRALISHVELPRAYRIAVLDTPANLLPGGARQERAQIDSTRAALYYPWVTVANPLARPGRDDIAREINLPPSSFLCGIYARNDVEKSVAKSPANEVVRSALRFESDVNFAQNQLLNPLGVNCLRYFPGRGYRVWGARTASSDPEWKYVNVRRYFLFLEASIDRGTQWAVFENNGERLWANIRETVEAFLYNEWISGNLMGSSPKEAFFVRCDRSTMTQNDFDNGRLICLVGVAALKPAEFVIFRIGQKTADAGS